jgi:hypothetical protein
MIVNYCDMVGESSTASNKWVIVSLQGHTFNLILFELDMSQEDNPFAATLGPEFSE